jgi:carbon-monoxide dehydrogenase medium subunit
LDDIQLLPDSIHIGATVTLQQLIDSAWVQEYGGGIVCRAARSRTVSKMIRNAATVGGELASTDPFSALAAVLLIFEATIEFFDSQKGAIPAADFFSAGRAASTQPMILTGIQLPRRPRNASSDLRCLAALTSSPPLLCVAASLTREGNRAAGVRIAISGGFDVPSRLPALERQLEGRPLDAEELEPVLEPISAQLNPPADIRATAEYRRRVAPILIRRSLLAAWEQSAQDGAVL